MHALVTEPAMPHLREILTPPRDVCLSKMVSDEAPYPLQNSRNFLSPHLSPCTSFYAKRKPFTTPKYSVTSALAYPTGYILVLFQAPKSLLYFLIGSSIHNKGFLNTESSVLDIWWREDSRTLLYHTARNGSVFTIPAIALWNLNQDIIFTPNFMLVCYCNLWVWQEHLYFWLSCYISLP